MPIDAGSPTHDPGDLRPDADDLADKIDLGEAGTGAPPDDDVDLDDAGKGAGNLVAPDEAETDEAPDELVDDDAGKAFDELARGASLSSHVLDEEPDVALGDEATVKADDDDGKFDDDDDKFDDDDSLLD